ncbi:hypothetical protein HYT45_03145 [Candidatus Uhrbacteria bacterium]|nr:hypothetical protein [Candidatus Uhrbacteria bacterium]
MKKTSLIALALLFAAGLFFAVRGSNPTNKNTVSALPSSQTAQSGSLEPQTNNEGAVSVTATPYLKNTEWKFDIALNTHSEELDDDLTLVSALFDENGKEYKPIGWDGAPTGGHHREGILKFQPISPLPASIELRMFISGIARNFTWPLR